jgi:mono/diheme cytochrome c family protein
MRRLAWQGITLVSVLLLAFTLLAEKPRTNRKSARGQEGPAARLAAAPVSAQALPNPFAGDATAEAAGRKLFLHHCATCHGRDARGLGHAANLHSPAVQAAPPGALFWAIRNGRLQKGMPSWSSLPKPEIWQIVTYLKSLR